jgi:predicted amidohydrolase YtcJ
MDALRRAPGNLANRALRGFTLDAAWSIFLDREIGSLEPGKRADLVVWGSDPMTVPAAEIPDATVDYTLVDGEIVHDRARPAAEAGR